MDTCQALSLYDAVDTPGLFLLASSNREESAWSHQYDSDINTSLNDKFSFYFYEFLFGVYKHKFTSKTTFKQMRDIFDFAVLDSHIELKITNGTKRKDLRLSEYIPLEKVNDVKRMKK